MSYAGRNMAEYCAEHNCDQSECRPDHEHTLLLDALRALREFKTCWSANDDCCAECFRIADKILTRAREMGLEVKP